MGPGKAPPLPKSKLVQTAALHRRRGDHQAVTADESVPRKRRADISGQAWLRRDRGNAIGDRRKCLGRAGYESATGEHC
jgi:hypothetical protein